MTSFNPDMQNEKLAAILLVIVIVGSISVFLTVTYGEDILNALSGKKTGEKVIALGDCVDVNYIGRYASNNTIFDSSYAYPTNKTGGTPLNIFVTLNQSEYPPEGYDAYSSGYIEGLIDGLVGLKEGQTSVINISAEKAYGAKKLKVDDTFSTKSLTESSFNYNLNQTVEVTDLSDESITLKWINVQDFVNFTLPEVILTEDFEQAYNTGTLYDNLPPYYIWENSSTIINVTDTNVLIKATPTKTQNLTKQVSAIGVEDKLGFIFPDATTAEWNETKITIESSPLPESKYTLDYGGMVINITVGNVTETHVNVSIEFQGESQPYELNRTIEFNRTYSMRRLYTIPLTFLPYTTIGNDIQKAGYGLSKLAGERLLFEVTILKVYKTS
jgi:FKBP-type peptidyl-prolyl cis-trans isomerase 2